MSGVYKFEGKGYSENEKLGWIGREVSEEPAVVVDASEVQQ